MRSPFVFLACLAGFCSATSAQLVVPSSAYPTIQSAIDAATPSQTIRVLPGTYKEQIDFKGKDVIVTSFQGAQSTIIDGQQQSPVVLFSGGETRAAVLEGFTITNGLTAASSPNGAGIRVVSASPTIRWCWITHNRHWAYGAGLGATAGSGLKAEPLVEDCWFAYNLAGGSGATAYASGGAIGMGTSGVPSVPEIRRCRFTDNEAATRGGGFYASYGFNALIEDCVFTRNKVGSGSGLNGGAAIFMSLNSKCVVRNCRIWNNDVPSPGSAVKYFNVTDCVLVNNTITMNLGGGIAGFCNAGSYGINTRALVHNCIVWQNGTPEISLAGTDAQNNPPSIVVQNCDVTGGYTGTGNIMVDPKLANAGSGNHRLLGGSPCFNVGDNAAPSLPTKDFEGDNRVFAGTVDIGADELVPGKILLYADTATLSVAKGGNPKFTIEAGSGHGGEVYCLLTSLSGATPGTLLGTYTLPLNLDFATFLLFPTLPGSLGLLDATGAANPTMPFVGPLPPPLLGMELTLAVALLKAGPGFTGVSNDEMLLFVQ